jgi:hypothetical protein
MDDHEPGPIPVFTEDPPSAQSNTASAPDRPINQLEVFEDYVAAYKTVPNFPDYHECITLLECTSVGPDGGPVRALDWVKQSIADDRQMGLMLTYNHTSYGYIKDGNASRFLWVPRALFQNSGSIGWYIHSAYRYSEINWTAYKPCIEPLLINWLHAGLIKIVTQWRHDDPPMGFKFFKGYFLAATNQDTMTLLNRATPPPSDSEEETVQKEEIKAKAKKPLWWLPVKEQMPAPNVPGSRRESKEMESPAKRRASALAEDTHCSPRKRGGAMMDSMEPESPTIKWFTPSLQVGGELASPPKLQGGEGVQQ